MDCSLFYMFHDASQRTVHAESLHELLFECRCCADDTININLILSAKLALFRSIVEQTIFMTLYLFALINSFRHCVHTQTELFDYPLPFWFLVERLFFFFLFG